MRIGYARISTKEQKEDRQITYLKSCGCEKIFIDKCSGKSFQREEYIKLKSFARQGDEIFISEVSRFGRNVNEGRKELEELLEKGIKITIKGIGELKKGDYIANLVTRIMLDISQFRREEILDLQRQGIEEAKKRGAYNKKKNSKTKKINIEEIHNYLRQGISKTLVAKKMGISRTSLYNIIKKKKKEVLDGQNNF